MSSILPVTITEQDASLIVMIAEELHITKGMVLTDLWDACEICPAIDDKSRQDILDYVSGRVPLCSISFTLTTKAREEISDAQDRLELTNSAVAAYIILNSGGWEDLLRRYSSSLNDKANAAYKLVGSRIKNPRRYTE